MSRSWDRLRGGGDPEDGDALDDPRRLADRILARGRASRWSCASVQPMPDGAGGEVTFTEDKHGWSSNNE
jgi:hypothetical protein